MKSIDLSDKYPEDMSKLVSYLASKTVDLENQVFTNSCFNAYSKHYDKIVCKNKLKRFKNKGR